MRKIIFLFVLLLQGLTVCCQEVTPQKILKDGYLKKSKNQKKAANILLFGGAGLVVTAFVFPRGEREATTGGFINWVTYKNDEIKGVMFFTGAISMLTSIPFYLSSGKNKRRARAITATIQNQEILLPKYNTSVLIKQPSLSLKLAL